MAWGRRGERKCKLMDSRVHRTTLPGMLGFPVHHREQLRVRSLQTLPTARLTGPPQCFLSANI